VLADWCSGAGGAGHGYQLAGFHVVGFDTKPQPRYPGCFVQADVMTAPLAGFDAFHASPPCVDHLRRRCAWVEPHGTGWLLDAIRDRMDATGKPWVLENVPGAPLRADYRLRQPCTHDDRPAVTVIRQGAFYLTARPSHSKRYVPLREAALAMGIEWMTKRELGDAVPPAYTADIGADLLAQLHQLAA
jgi:hypothetical protein